MSRRPSSHPAAPWGAFFGCSLIWGSTFLFISIGNDTMPAVWAATIRLAIAAAILLVLARIRKEPLPRGAALRSTIWYGVLVFGLNFPLLYWGEQWVPSGITAVMYATLPLSTPLMARAFGLEILRPLKLAGGAVALVGVIAIFWRQLGGGVGALPLTSIVAAATLAGLGTIVLKRGPRQPAIPVNGLGSLVGCAMCLGLSFVLGEPHPWPTSLAQLFPILYLAVLGSVVAFTLVAWLVNHWDATNIAFISVVNPVTAVTLGVLVRGERLEAATAVGAALVIVGVLLAVQSDRRVRRASAGAA